MWWEKPWKNSGKGNSNQDTLYEKKKKNYVQWKKNEKILNLTHKVILRVKWVYIHKAFKRMYFVICNVSIFALTVKTKRKCMYFQHSWMYYYMYTEQCILSIF